MLTVRVARARAIGRLAGGTSGPAACDALALASRVDDYRAEEAAMALIRREPQALSQRDSFGGWLFDWPDLSAASSPSGPCWPASSTSRSYRRRKLVVRVELPGIDPDKDVELTVSEGALHVRAERRQEKTVEDKEEYRSELRYGAFSRVLPLPVGTSEKDITATYTAGILEIRVPFDQKKAEVTRIPITTK